MTQMVYTFFLLNTHVNRTKRSWLRHYFTGSHSHFSHTVFCILTLNTNNVFINLIFHVLGQEFAPLYTSLIIINS